MDRDSREERTQAALDLLVEDVPGTTPGPARPRCAPPTSAGETDEFVAATTVGDEATIRAGDSVLAFNFRPDRMRQLSVALTGARDVRYTTLTEYDEGWHVPGRVPPGAPGDDDRAGRRRRRAGQLHVAETEKYPHVTYFFNGGEEEPYPGSAASWCRRRATSRPTTTSRR